MTKFEPIELNPTDAHHEEGNQEKKHQKSWETVAAWCWDREIYLACLLHDRSHIKIIGRAR